MFLCILFFHMVIVKHETHHLHDFMVKMFIFNVNRVIFDQDHALRLSLSVSGAAKTDSAINSIRLMH